MKTPPRPLSALLAPLGWAYGGLQAARAAMYRRKWLRTHRLPGAVVSFGNLSVGGTGKTPLVCWAARHLVTRGHRVAVLARGYGLQVGGEEDDERVPPELAAFPVRRFNHPDRRVSGAEAFGEWKASCALLDDGFQHLRVARELDVVCVDASTPLGRPLPAGRLRELPSALRRAGHLVLTRVDQASAEQLVLWKGIFARHSPGVPVAEARMKAIGVQRGEELLPPQTLAGARVLAFSGIGNPEAFERTLSQAGAQVAEAVRFSDHHPYTQEDLLDLERRRERAGATLLLTTRKDLFRMASPPQGVAALVVAVEFVSGEQALTEAIEYAVEQKPIVA